MFDFTEALLLIDTCESSKHSGYHKMGSSLKLYGFGITYLAKSGGGGGHRHSFQTQQQIKTLRVRAGVTGRGFKFNCI